MADLPANQGWRPSSSDPAVLAAWIQTHGSPHTADLTREQTLVNSTNFLTQPFQYSRQPKQHSEVMQKTNLTKVNTD